jgi:hypothetical protein
MQIAENSPSRLRLVDHKLWVALVPFAAASLGATLFALHPGKLSQLTPIAFFGLFSIFFLRWSDVVFDKIARTCVVHRCDFLRTTTRNLTFDQISDVRVDVSQTVSPPIVKTFGLTLVTAAGATPLTVFYESKLLRYEAMRQAVADVVFSGPRRPPDANPAAAA